MQDTLDILLRADRRPNWQRKSFSLIPSGTKLRGVSVRGSTAIVDFNDTFGYNRYGKEGYIAQLKQIVYTLTEFQNIKDVQFLIEGKTRAFLSEGVALDTPLSRSQFLSAACCQSQRVMIQLNHISHYDIHGGGAYEYHCAARLACFPRRKDGAFCRVRYADQLYHGSY